MRNKILIDDDVVVVSRGQQLTTIGGWTSLPSDDDFTLTRQLAGVKNIYAYVRTCQGLTSAVLQILRQ